MALTALSEAGVLRVTFYGLAHTASHIAWITAGACFIMSALVLRGGLRSLALVSLALLTAACMICFVVLPETGLRFVPQAEEIARDGDGRTQLVGLRVQPLSRSAHVLVCEEREVFPGLVWNRVIFKMPRADRVEFAAYGHRQYRCSFPPWSPGDQPRSRFIRLRSF